MKKNTFLLLTIILALTMFAGCRRQLDGEPGDPTVNNSSTAETTTVTMPSMTANSSESTRSTTIPNSTNETENIPSGTNLIPGESATDGNTRNRNRIIPNN